MPLTDDDTVIGNLERALEGCEDEEVAYHIRTALQLLEEEE